MSPSVLCPHTAIRAAAADHIAQAAPGARLRYLHLHLLNLQGAPASFATRRTYLRFHTAWTRSRHCRQVADSSLRTPQAMDWIMDLLQAKKTCTRWALT